MKTYDKYKQNLRVHEDKVYSYDTAVATIDFDNKQLHVDNYYSRTTSKHINYVAQQEGLTIAKEYN